MFNGVEYHDGDMFRMDACHFCRCQGGVSVCFTAQCGVLHCERYYVPEGECCPVCEGDYNHVAIIVLEELLTLLRMNGEYCN